MIELLEIIKNHTKNPIVRIICAFIFALIVIITVQGAYSTIMNVINSVENIRDVRVHHERFVEQLNENHPYKINMNDHLYKLNRFAAEYEVIANEALDIAEELIKYELGKIDITELGMFEAIAEHEFNEAKPKHFIFVGDSNKSITKLKMKLNNSQGITLYRNDYEVPFDYRENEPLLMYYIENPDIAIINYNRITGVKKGKTKLVIVYRGGLLVCGITVR